MTPGRLASLVVREVTRETWPDFERLFEARGGPSYCWCMAFRATREELRGADRASRKAQMLARVNAGTPVGILGYVRSEPVAWCSIAPRHTFRKLVSDGSSDEGVWSITCFYVPRRHRGAGIAAAMLAAAVRHAEARGARLVEAYPVDPQSPSYRHMGFLPTFQRAGFTECGREGKRRHVVRLAVGRSEGDRIC